MTEIKQPYTFDQHSKPPEVITMSGAEYDRAIARARVEEREACAQVADNLGRDAKELNRARGGGWEDYPTAAMLIAQRIRAREQATT